MDTIMIRLAFLLLTLSATAQAEISVTDGTGSVVRLAQPAQRIVSLAPHVTEVLFAAGAGERIVGTVDYSNFPEAAKRIRRVGGYSRIDLEAVAALKPDLVIGWHSGNAPAHVDKLKALGLTVYVARPHRFEDIAASIEQYGRLAGTQSSAEPAAATFRQRLAELRLRYASRRPVRVFYQVWQKPLTTINGQQIISDAIGVCGGINVFAELPVLAPKINTEAVLVANPEAIIASGMDEQRPEWLDDWRRWPQLDAVTRGNLFFIPPDLIQRHSPRLLDGAAMLCEQLETARGRR
jgi:iron complex transport system substrate-binding protein